MYSLDTVTYGTKRAEILAIRAIQQLTYDEEAEFPLAANILRTNLYVDCSSLLKRVNSSILSVIARLYDPLDHHQAKDIYPRPMEG